MHYVLALSRYLTQTKDFSHSGCRPDFEPCHDALTLAAAVIGSSPSS
jgi:hypothetical protein